MSIGYKIQDQAFLTCTGKGQGVLEIRHVFAVSTAFQQ